MIPASTHDNRSGHLGVKDIPFNFVGGGERKWKNYIFTHSIWDRKHVFTRFQKIRIAATSFQTFFFILPLWCRQKKHSEITHNLSFLPRKTSNGSSYNLSSCYSMCVIFQAIYLLQPNLENNCQVTTMIVLMKLNYRSSMNVNIFMSVQTVHFFRPPPLSP